MSKFKLPEMTGLKDVIEYLRRVVPMVGRELEAIRKSIPAKGPTAAETAAALLEDPEFKDAIYRYVKYREAKE